MKKPITVVLIEDAEPVSRAMETILNRAPDCRCVGRYISGEAAVAAIPSNPPDVIIADINLPGINGVECVRQLVDKGVTSNILMLTARKDTDTIFQALEAGATGYLVKPVHADQLLVAVRDIYAGGAPMTSSIARKIVQTFQRKPEKAGPDETLSEREAEVLKWLAAGHAYKEIADVMKIGYGTVHTYIARIYKKLQVSSRAQAVAKHLTYL